MLFTFGCPSPGNTIFTIVMCLLQDCRVVIWTNDGNSNNWTPTVLNKFKDVVWHLSWSITGNILAVSGGDNKVCLCAIISWAFFFISSPEHKVLMVSFCDRPMSVVRRPQLL